MTTYTLNPNATWLAVYNLNTGTMPTNNVVFSELTADIWKNDTSITLKTGEWALFTWWMVATIEQLQDDWKTATAREVVLISWINGDTLTITRWYEKCVMNDTATPKVMWNEKQTFTSWARISVYVSKALLNWVQTRLAQVNCPCNTQVYNDSLAISSCVANNCDDWRDKLYSEKARRCYNDCWFWDWSDWDCVITQNTFLCANCDYNFRNLTICSWVLVRFEWQGVPRINVQRKFCNLWTIDLRWWTFVWACSKTDWLTGCSVWNNACAVCYNAMCWWCWWSWWWGYWSWTSWANASWNSWWAWWNWGCWYEWHYCRCWSYWTVEQWNCWSPAVWCNGWKWGKWYWPASWECDCWTIIGYDWWGWWGWGWAPYGNGWDWWNAWAAGWYGCFRGCWGNGWNSWIWWTGWKWGDGWNWTWNCNNWFISWNGWNWGNGYIGWNGWRNAASNYHGSWNAWHGWKWIICWWQWADRIEHDYMINGCSRAWNGWMAINNMYWLIIHACEYYNYCIMAKGWDWWRWWDAPNWQWSSSWSRWNTWGYWGCGANGANGWHISVAYIKLLQGWTVNVSKWLWWRWWYNNCAYGCTTQQPGWADWSDWRYKICKPF